MSDKILFAFLEANLGKKLTKGLGLQIMRVASMLDPLISAENMEQILPEEHEGFVFAVERMEEILSELKLLHQEHWKETEGYRAEIPLNPDYMELIRHEHAGRFIVFTLRCDGRLVGNFSLFIAKSHQTQTLVASEDTLYVAPEARGTGAAKGLMEYSEKALHKLGVNQITASVKLVNNAGAFLQRMGYSHVADGYSKILKEENHVL